MKKITLLLLAIAATPIAYGQNNLLGYKNGKPVSVSQYIKCTSFSVTKPLRELAKQQNNTTPSEEERNELIPQVGNGKGYDPTLRKDTRPDPVRQGIAGTLALDTPLVNWEGGNWAYRPDISCATGPNHVVQAFNLGSFNIYNKTGTLLLSTTMNTIGSSSGVSSSDDPIVMYDKFADRWFVSDVTQGYTSLTVAVSVTNDPTGAYYVWTYAFPVMPDFPKYSIWSDGYYSTYRDINNDTVGVCVFERDRMLKGDPTAGAIISKFPNAKVVNPNSQLPGSPKILTCDGALPPFGTPAYLMYYTNVNMGDPTNSIMIYKLVTDTTNKTCKMLFVDSLATANYDGYFTGYAFGGNIREPGNQYVWSLEGPFQYRVTYVRFVGYSSVVLCNTVNAGDSIGGIRWYELRQNDTSMKWSVYQQGTYAPNDGVSRWNGSICMNLNGDIALAYNVTDSLTLHPGIRYTGRLVSDPLGQMTFAEQTAMKGTHSFNIQWGDYSSSALDPDGLTFWHTNQYIIDPTGNTANTRVFSFRLSNTLNGVSNVAIPQPYVKAYQVSGFLQVIATDLPSNDKVVVNLFDVNGKQLASQWLVPKANYAETKFNVSMLPAGIYLVRLGNSGFQRVVKVMIN